MKTLILAVFVLAIVDSNPIKEYQWKNRLIIVNCGPDVSSCQKQKLSLSAKQKELKDRDVLLLYLENQVCKMPDGTIKRADRFFDYLDIDPNSFEVLLVGKDGGVKYRKRKSIDPQIIFTLIDGMPMRQQEMRRIKGKNKF